MGIFSKIFDKNRMLLKKYSRIVEAINGYEQDIEKFEINDFAKKTDEFKARVSEGQSLDSVLPEAFALAREAAKRAVGMRPFDVQLMGALALNEGKIAEMKTGEGKTLVATMPLYLNALSGKGCHLATVNDYLAKRDAGWMGPVYEYLGLRAGFIQAAMEPSLRKDAYNCDITYGTANEFGFDYLRDNLVYSLENKVQRGHNFVIVDEADSILIDEARTPLIISGPAQDSSNLYRQFAFFAKRFQAEKDFVVDEKDRTVTLTDEGIAKAEKLLQIDNLYDPSNYDYIFHLLNALKAMILYKKEVDYLVTQEGEVVIVDEFTGRLLPGRRYSEGLHQAIEAKENVQIRQESVTFATITFQNYFKQYDKVAGMTGTAATEESEFISMYNTPVAVIPTNKDVIRQDKEDSIYKTKEEKNEAIINEIAERYEKGQPVLVGTTSIEKSELLSKMLQKRGVPHEVLNAKYHEREAEIVAKAGERKTITIATNMAGRGTDIKLGDGVVELGGLYVLGTERHESRRIDNQLVGRSGRQGDPGESRFFLSTEDDLIRLFGGERMQSIMNTLKIERGQPIEHSLLSRIIFSAQKKIEGMHFEIRKRLYELDSVIDQQRSAIYAHRDWVLKGDEIDSNVFEIIEDVVDRRLSGLEQLPPFEDIKVSFSFLPAGDIGRLKGLNNVEELRNSALSLLQEIFVEKKTSFGDEFPQVMKYIMLRMIDERWRRHLEAIEHLKDSVGLRAYGQKDPVIEFKKESFILFQQLTDSLYDDIASAIVRIVRVDSDKAKQNADKEFRSLQAVHSDFSGSGGDKKGDVGGKKKGTKRFKVKR